MVCNEKEKMDPSHIDNKNPHGDPCNPISINNKEGTQVILQVDDNKMIYMKKLYNAIICKMSGKSPRREDLWKFIKENIEVNGEFQLISLP